MIKLIRALRKNYFDDTIDLAKLSKSFLLWGVGVVLVYIGNIFLTRLIGLPRYGQYTVFMTWVSLGSTFVTFGWDGYFLQKIPKLSLNANGKIEAGSVLRQSLISFLVLFTFLAGVLFFLKYQLKMPLIFSDDGAMLIFLLFVFLFTAISYFKSILKIFNTITPVQWMEDISKPLLLFGFFGFYYFLHRTLSLSTVYFINLLLFSGIMVGAYLLIHKRVEEKTLLHSRDRNTDQWIRRCFYFLCISLGYTFFSKMELLFLGYYSKNEEGAKYQLLLRIADLVILPDFLFNYYLPQKFSHLFAAADHSGAAKLFRNAARAIFVCQVICLTGVAAVGYFYLQSFNIASPQMYILLLVLCGSQLFYSLFGSTNLVLMTSGNEKYSFLALTMVLAVEAAANIIFIPTYGLIAAVHISWVSVLVYTLVLFLFVHKKLKFKSPLIRLA